MQGKLNDSFLEQYGDRFSAKIVSQFFESHSVITGKEILSVTPSKQVNFFVLKILFTKWQEEMKNLESPYFDFKDQEVRRALVSFMNTLSQKIEVDRSNFEPLLKQAVQDTLLLLVHPAGFIEQEFQDKSSATVSERNIKNFLKYIKVHKSELEQFMGDKTDVSQEEMLEKAAGFFESLDLKAIADFELSILADIEPIALESLILSEEPKEEETIPLLGEELDEEAVVELDEPVDDEVLEQNDDDEPEEKLLDEEGQTAEEIDEDENDTDSEDDFEGDEEVEEAFMADEEESAEPEDEVVSEADEENDPMGDTDDEDEPVELNEKFAEPESKILHDNYEKEHVTLADQLQQTKISSIMEAISINNRYMFTNELFGGDKDQFQVAISTMEACETFDDAVELLVQDYAKNYDWDMNSDEVKELLKVIFRKFR